jgi:hypothetical protein
MTLPKPTGLRQQADDCSRRMIQTRPVESKREWESLHVAVAGPVLTAFHRGSGARPCGSSQGILWIVGAAFRSSLST